MSLNYVIELMVNTFSFYNLLDFLFHGQIVNFQRILVEK